MWVIFRQVSEDEAIPVAVYRTLERAQYYAGVLAKKTKAEYHVRAYTHNEGTWL